MTAITVYTTNIQPLSSVIGSLPLINPSPFGLGVYQWQASSDLGLRSYICCIHLLAVVYILHICMYVCMYVCIYIYIPMRGRIKEGNRVITKISLGDD